MLETNILQNRFEKLWLHIKHYVLLSRSLCMFHFSMKNIIERLKIIPSLKLPMNYTGYLQTEGTGVEKGRTDNVWGDLYFKYLMTTNRVFFTMEICTANLRMHSVCVWLGGLGWGVEWTAKLGLSKKGKAFGVKYMVEDCVPEERGWLGRDEVEKKKRVPHWQ